MNESNSEYLIISLKLQKPLRTRDGYLLVNSSGIRFIPSSSSSKPSSAGWAYIAIAILLFMSSVVHMFVTQQVSIPLMIVLILFVVVYYAIDLLSVIFILFGIYSLIRNPREFYRSLVREEITELITEIHNAAETDNFEKFKYVFGLISYDWKDISKFTIENKKEFLTSIRLRIGLNITFLFASRDYRNAYQDARGTAQILSKFVTKKIPTICEVEL